MFGKVDVCLLLVFYKVLLFFREVWENILGDFVVEVDFFWIDELEVCSLYFVFWIKCFGGFWFVIINSILWGLGLRM